MPDSPNDLIIVTPYPGKSPYYSGETLALMKQLGGLRSYHLVTNDGDIVATLDVWYEPSRRALMSLWDAKGCRTDGATVLYEELQEGVLERKMTEMLERNGLRFITSLV